MSEFRTYKIFYGDDARNIHTCAGDAFVDGLGVLNIQDHNGMLVSFNADVWKMIQEVQPPISEDI